MDRSALAARKREMADAAATRWQANAPDVARTAARLARGGPEAASSPERVEQFRAREAIKRPHRPYGVVGEERIIGPVNWQEYPPSEAARVAGRPVARIVELGGGGRIGEGIATGFLVAPGLLFTNWHVFPEAAYVGGCGAQFGYERNRSRVAEAGTIFDLDPDAFFLSDRSLDIAIVAVAPTPRNGANTLDSFGAVRLIPAPGKLLVGHPINIVQHPGGQVKHWAVEQNKLILEPRENDLFLTYSTDTLEGSSGSPAFNYDWELTAVHHSGVPRRVDGRIKTIRGDDWVEGMPDSDIDWVANEGVRVSKVVAFLRGTRIPDAGRQDRLSRLLAGIDTTGAGIGPESPRPIPAVIPTGGAPPMNIVVNGTANFYFGGAAQAPTPPAPPPPALVAAEARIRFDPDYPNRPGYQSDFLDGFDVPAPTAPVEEVLRSGRGPLVLRYHHYSLVMHKSRRLAMWTAANADYDENKRRKDRKEFGTDTWKPDPRIPIEAQIEDTEFYEPAKKFDRGHLVRRDDVAWGETAREEEYGNSDSFHWTNCTPQHEHFNRDIFGYHGLWGRVENHITAQAANVGNRLIILAGPVLDPHDESRDFGSGIRVQVPAAFWKVVVAVETGAGGARALRAYGFLLDQTDAITRYGWEGRFSVGAFREEQASLSEITAKSRVEFPDVLTRADPLANERAENRRRLLRSLADIMLR